ncbi:hypothetical protein [Anthocerotibacter panamensis]|uniref:hypothetical protein n=1 Tax=Anthocerotibacter panamensis TaxID=2857077 RepID=UPI001C4037F3|nr:hypothetical protein [Anthocerotibacter panamensis]
MLRKFLDSLAEACFQMLRPSFRTMPPIGTQPYDATTCRTSDGKVCTLNNLERIPDPS